MVSGVILVGNCCLLSDMVIAETKEKFLWAPSLELVRIIDGNTDSIVAELIVTIATIFKGKTIFEYTRLHIYARLFFPENKRI